MAKCLHRDVPKTPKAWYDRTKCILFLTHTYSFLFFPLSTSPHPQHFLSAYQSHLSFQSDLMMSPSKNKALNLQVIFKSGDQQIFLPTLSLISLPSVVYWLWKYLKFFTFPNPCSFHCKERAPFPPLESGLPPETCFGQQNGIEVTAC